MGNSIPTMTASPVIELTDVSKTYYLGDEPVYALKNLTLTIKEQEYLGIVGSSGCGKSTLMYLMGLLETPTSGRLILNQRDVSRLPDDQLSRVRNQTVGFIFQAFNLINKYTVLENVLLPARYCKIKLDFNPQQRALELLEKFGISHRQRFFPNKISGGEQQRTAIARALIMHPKIILADEPTGNLDTKNGDEIMNLLESLGREFGTTIVVVTHEPDVARRTHRQIHMRDGQIIT